MSAVAKPDRDSEVQRRQRGRNLALMAALIAFCVLIYLVTIVRLGGA